MNKLLFFVAAIVLSACSSIPKPVEPEGDKSNVNPPVVYLIELYKKEGV
ncbi:hypothetical protein [uncultured Shewanella sp.]|nr:hypothetical protein [uncultured Shewanella sp.]